MKNFINFLYVFHSRDASQLNAIICSLNNFFDFRINCESIFDFRLVCIISPKCIYHSINVLIDNERN